jgi:hypothetical protein
MEDLVNPAEAVAAIWNSGFLGVCPVENLADGDRRPIPA